MDAFIFFLSFFTCQYVGNVFPSLSPILKTKEREKKKGCKAPRPGYTGLSAGSALRFFFDFFL